MKTAFRQFRVCTLHFLLATTLLTSACTADTITPTTSPTTKPATPSTSTAPATQPVHFDSTPMTLKGQNFSVELALNNEQNERGLMYRDFLPADHGMLFVMPYEKTWSFWMHETRIPLDIVYIDKNQKVIEIQKRKPFDENGGEPAKPALYVLELNQGVSEKIGLKPGDTVEIPRKYVKN